MANNLTLSVTLTGDGRQLSGTLKDARNDVREFGTTTERESRKADAALTAPGRSTVTVSEHLRDAGREARTFGTETAQGGRVASQALSQTSGEAQTVTGHLDQLRTVAAGVGVALATIGARDFVMNAYAAVSSSQQLQGSLKTVTGSIENASAAWDTLLGFAAETPFTLDQSVQAFIRMQSLGLNPSLEALRSYGNTASAMGKDMMQMVEAVADATTGEFERLKEFGIRASKEGEQISFTFQGVTTTVANSAAAISQYLQQIGENQFAGAMGDQMDTLSGKASNLEDTIYQFYLAVGDAGAADIFESTLANASNTVQFLTDNIDTLASGAEVMAALIGGRVVVAVANVTAAKLAATQQTVAYQMALARMAGVSTTAAAGQTALAAATRGASAAMALVGGPAGAALLAAGAIIYFRDELGLTQQAIGYTEEELASLRQEMADMDGVQITQTLSQVEDSLMQVGLKAAAAREELAQLRSESGGSGVLGFEGGRVGEEIRGMQAVAEYTEKMTELEQKRAVMQEELTSRTQEGTVAMNDMTVTAARLTGETESLGKATGETAEKTYTVADSYEALLDRITPNRTAARQYAQSQGVLNLALASGRINTVQYMQAMGLLQENFQAAQRETDNLAAKTVDAAFTMEGAFDELRLNGLRRLDDGFADLWQGAIDGSLNASEIMKRALDQTLAEMAHIAITRPITVQLATSMGLGGGGQQASMGSSGGFGINPMSLGGAGQSFGNAFRAFQGTGSTYAGTFGAELAVQTEGGLRAGFNSFANSGFGNAALGVGGGLAGGWASGAMFGQSQEQQIGSTLGGLAGQVLIPIPGVGAAVGSFLGGALGSAFAHSPTPFRGEFVTRDSQFDATGYSRDDRVAAMRSMADQDFYYGGFYAQSELGDLGFSHSGSQRLHRADGGPMDDSNLHERAEWGWELAESAAQMDNLVVTLAQGSSDVEAMRDAVQSMSLRSGDAADIIQFALVDRSLAALDAAGIAVSERFRHMGADTFAAELQLAVAAVNTLGGASSRLNLQFDAASDGALLAADNIAQYVGGLDNLSALQSQYYQAFFTEEERLAHLTEDLTAQFAAMGMALPDTREGVRDVVESLELMGAAGQEQLATILQLNQPLAQYIAAMEDQRAATNGATDSIADYSDAIRTQDSLERELLRAQGNTEALRQRELDSLRELAGAEQYGLVSLQERIWAIEDETAAQQAATEAQQQLVQEAEQIQQRLMSGVQSAYQTVEQAVNAERQILENAYRETTASIDRNMQTVQDAMRDAESASRSLNNALRETQSGTAFARQQGQATLRAMLAAGEVTDQRELDDALSAVAEPSEHLFGSFLDYQRDFVGTAHDIYNLSQLTDDQLSTEEQSLVALEKQLRNADLQHRREMAQLDRLLMDQAAIIEAEFGTQSWLSSVNDSVLSVQDAINALELVVNVNAPSSSGGGSVGSGSGGSGGGSGSDFDEATYLANKTNQVNKAGFQGRTDWTHEQVLDAINRDYGSLENHYDAIGQSEGVTPYATGAWKLESDQLAMVHKNEFIAPDRGGIADEFRAYAAGDYQRELMGELSSIQRALPIPNLPPMPFINQQANGNNDMAVLVKRIEALTEQTKTQGGMQREALKALKALVRQLERWDDQDRVRVSVEKTVEPTT